MILIVLNQEDIDFMISISDRCNMTYENYINQPMSMCERKINMIISKNPPLINSLDRKKSSSYQKIFSYTIY